jgi:hypothetical protein
VRRSRSLYFGLAAVDNGEAPRRKTSSVFRARGIYPPSRAAICSQTSYARPSFPSSAEFRSRRAGRRYDAALAAYLATVPGSSVAASALKHLETLPQV